MHRVVALALPDVVAFDLAIPAQVFGHKTERGRYSFRVCAAQPGLVPTTSGYSIQATDGLDALLSADTVVVPAYEPLDDPPADVCEALRQPSSPTSAPGPGRTWLHRSQWTIWPPTPAGRRGASHGNSRPKQE